MRGVASPDDNTQAVQRLSLDSTLDQFLLKNMLIHQITIPQFPARLSRRFGPDRHAGVLGNRINKLRTCKYYAIQFTCIVHL